MRRIVVCAVLIPVTAACGASAGSPARQEPVVPETVQVTYDADFTAPEVYRGIYGATFKDGAADVTYTTGSGVGQQQGVAVPIVTGNGRGIRVAVPVGSPVVFMVQNAKDYGTVTCRILGSGGVVLAETVSDGAYAVAKCEAVAG